MSSSEATGPYAPARVLSVDIATGEVIDLDGSAHPRAHVLVRSQGQPLVVLDVEDAPADPQALLARVRRLAVDLPSPRREQRDRQRGPLVSVVVPSLHNVGPTVACVGRILESTHREMEVLVVDNGDLAGELRAALEEAFGHDPRVRPLHEPRRGLSRARNAGLAAARGEVVVFTDDDVRVDVRWLERIVEAFADEPRAGCVTGPILPMELVTRAQWRLEEYGGYSKGFERQVYDLDENSREDPLYPYDSGRFGSGANLAFRTQVLRDLGGFAMDLGAGTPAYGGEDLDITRRVVSEGHVLVYEPAALLWHAHRRSDEALRRQMYRYGAGLTATVTKWVVEDRHVAVDVLRRVPQGLRHLLASASRKNASKTRSFPASLTWIERWGMLVGPLLYLRSRRAIARRRSRQDRATAGAPPSAAVRPWGTVARAALTGLAVVAATVGMLVVLE